MFIITKNNYIDRKYKKKKSCWIFDPICKDQSIFPYEIVNAVFKDYFVKKIIKKLRDIGHTTI